MDAPNIGQIAETPICLPCAPTSADFSSSNSSFALPQLGPPQEPAPSHLLLDSWLPVVSTGNQSDLNQLFASLHSLISQPGFPHRKLPCPPPPQLPLYPHSQVGVMVSPQHSPGLVTLVPEAPRLGSSLLQFCVAWTSLVSPSETLLIVSQSMGLGFRQSFPPQLCFLPGFQVITYMRMTS